MYCNVISIALGAILHLCAHFRIWLKAQFDVPEAMTV